MKLEWLKIIILAILIVVFLLYINIKNITESILKEVKEGFQSSDTSSEDIQTNFFDLSANYMSFTSDELGPQPSAGLDEIILDVGDSFGNVDADNISWDTENKELTTTEALWGIVPSQASSVLFSKVYAANQLQDPSTLQVDDTTNQFSYEDPVFGVQTDNTDAATALQVADQAMNALQYVMIADMVTEGKAMHIVTHIISAAVKAPIRILKVLGKALRLVFKLLSNSKVDSKIFKRIAKLTGVINSVGVFFEKAIEQVKRVINRVITRITTKLFTWFAELIGSEVIATGILSATQTWLIAPFIILYTLAAGIMMVLSTAGVLDPILSKSMDPQGCCPPGTIALDIALPSWANLLLSLVCPPWGDFVGYFYDYVCIDQTDASCHPKMTPTTPKWMTDYGWCTFTYLPWPQYDCSVVSVPVVLGKQVTGGSATGCSFDWNNGGFHTPFTNLDWISANPDSYSGYTAQIVNMQKNITENYILGSAGQQFFFCDFSEPTILQQMAQFYYDWSIRNPYPNDDGTVSVDIITKINYVEASSLYTCDVMCEITTVTFDPMTGGNYSEAVSYDHDRRFYFGCDANQPCPKFWENTSDSTWMTLDDAYDSAVYALEWAVHDIPPTDPSADIPTVPYTSQTIITAYRMKNEASNRFLTTSNDYVHANSNNSNFDPLFFEHDPDVLEILGNYFLSNANYLNILDTTLHSSNTTSTRFQTNTNYDPLPSDLTSLDTLVQKVISASNDLWNYHKQISPSGTYINQQYQLFGCTHLDATASTAAAPDPMSGDEESRFYCDFDVRPYIQRCKTPNISMAKCMDPSNIEFIIYNYYNQNPNKRIQSILSVQPKGSNACEFIWNEAVLNPATNSRTIYSNVVTDVLYQIDLSSCAFCLPTSNIADSNSPSMLYGTQTNCINPLSAAPTGTNYFARTTPASDAIYQSNTGIKNPSLAYYQTTYKEPVFGSSNVEGVPQVTSFNIHSNVDYVPRYDPVSFASLPVIRRPKAPIRVFYPNEVEEPLGGRSNDFCSNPLNLEKFILAYNQDSNNVNKIMKVIRAYTSGISTCDMEYDMYNPSNNTVVRATHTFNMKTYEGFQNSIEGFQDSTSLEEVFYVAGEVGNAYSISRSNADAICANYGGVLATLAQLSNAQLNGADWCASGWVLDDSNNAYYPITTSTENGCGNGSRGIMEFTPASGLAGVNCYAIKPDQGTDPLVYPFNSIGWNSYNVYTYDSVNSNQGLLIIPDTEPLADPNSAGFGWVSPYMTQFTQSIIPYTTYFNNDLIKGFTSKTQGMYENTAKLYQGLVRTNTLGGSNCPTKCSDPEIIERIIEQYDIDNTPNGRFGQTQNTMLQVTRAATDSNNVCKVIFENKQDLYGDYYLNDTSSSNYLTVNNLFIQQFPMENNPNTCTFYSVPNSASDILADDIALSSADDFNTYITPSLPVQGTCLPPNCRDPTLLNAAISDYQNTTGNTVQSVTQSMVVGHSDYVQSGICQYMINQVIKLDDGTISDTISSPFQVTYTNTLYTSNTTTCDTNGFSYQSGNFIIYLGDEFTNILPDGVDTYIPSDNWSQYAVVMDVYGSNAPAIVSYNSSNPSSDPMSSLVNTTPITSGW